MNRHALARTVLGAVIVCFAGTGALAQEPIAPPEEQVTFEAADGVVIVGDLYMRHAKDAPMILLFHQAGANAAAEYASIVPRLEERGYNVLAIDQRSGGSRLGGENRTVERLAKKDLHYCDAYPDLEAALQYVIDRGFTGPRLVWGSSYSAALVIHLGVDHKDDIAGVLAFSPAAGAPMGSCDPTDAIQKIEVPVLALRPASEMKNERTRKQFETFKKLGHRTYVSENGVHGSSMLNPKRVEGSIEKTWNAVFDFIDTVVNK
jgi:alpha-beta hydrolase superfamily lysophospholipase